MNYKEYLLLEITIGQQLSDIANYIDSAYYYLTNEYVRKPKDHVVKDLSKVPAKVIKLRELMNELESNYREDIESLELQIQ